MARTPSNMIPLGFKAPDFELPDVVSSKKLTLNEQRGEKATVVMFICNHCPFVVHVIEQIVAIANDYQDKGISVIAINSNDVENYPDDSPEKMTIFAKQNNFSFPYLFDESQEVAKAYDAACTPDFFVFNNVLECVYRGQMDGARPGNELPVTGEDLRRALDCILADNPISDVQIPSIGCNIKWKTSTSV